MQLDTPMHLYNYPANRFVAGFIGSPTMNFLKGSIQKENGYFFIHETQSFKFPLGNSIPSVLENFNGKPILIGIRPEHIVVCEDENNRVMPDCTLTINAYENMGSEQLIYFSLLEQTIVLRRAPREMVEVGHQKGIHLIREKIVFMNEENGEVISNQ